MERLEFLLPVPGVNYVGGRAYLIVAVHPGFAGGSGCENRAGAQKQKGRNWVRQAVYPPATRSASPLASLWIATVSVKPMTTLQWPPPEGADTGP